MMKRAESNHRWLPYLVAVASFLALSLVYFAPVLEGRQLPMHDITQYEGMSRDIVEHQQESGQDPQWAGRMFSGMPAYLISVKYDSQVIKRASSWLAGVAMPASLVFLAMLCFFAMTLMCRINPWVGIIPSLAYGLSTYFFIIIGAGHITKMVALAYAPLVVGAVWYAFKTNMWTGAALAALFLSIEIGAGHPQITYYFGFIVLALWINELCIAVREKWLPRFARTTGLLAVALLLGVGSNLVSLYHIQAHSKYTTRGGSELSEATANDVNPKGLGLQYATAWSYGMAESFNMLIPDLMGGSSIGGGFKNDGPVSQTLLHYNARGMEKQLPSYWGEQPVTNGPTYLGAVALFLAVAGLFALRGRNKWWLLAVSAVAVMLAWGHHMMWLTKLFFDVFPGYDKFRTVSMILVIVEWTVPFLAALFLYKAWKGGYDAAKMKKALMNALYVTGGVALTFLVLGGAFFDFTGPNDGSLFPGDIVRAMAMERASMMRMDALRSLIFIVLAWGVVWFMVKGSMKRTYAYIALAVLVCADMLPVNARYLPQSSFVEPQHTAVKPTEADKRIMADPTPGFRVANMTVSTFNDATTSYFHRSVGGYHGAKLQRYQDLIDRQLSRMNMQVYNMLNTRWFIVPEGQNGPPAAQLNPEANGAAWFVRDVVLAGSPDEEIAALDTIDTKTTAVVDGRHAGLKADAIPVDTTAVIELTDYRVNRLTYKYHAAVPQMAVFSEIYYPDGWTATLDGQPLDYFRADYVLRAAMLPAGDHEVVFEFRAPHFALLSAITLACSILILLAVAAAFTVTTFCCKKKDGEGQQ